MTDDKGRERFPNLPERIIGLGNLAYNLWWSWNPAAHILFKMIDLPAWKDSGHNPVKMLKDIPTAYLLKVSNEPKYLERYDNVMERFTSYMKSTEC